MTEVDHVVREVFWKRTLKVRIIRGNREEGNLREDWAEVTKEADGIMLFLGEDEERLTLSKDVVEAIYDMHQEIPR